MIELPDPLFTPVSEMPMLIVHRMPFVGVSMRAEVFRLGDAMDHPLPTRLVGRDHDEFLRDRPTMVYVVYNYGMPVAWKNANRTGMYVVTGDYGPVTFPQELAPVLHAVNILLARDEQLYVRTSWECGVPLRAPRRESVEDANGYIDGTYWHIWSGGNVFSPDISQPYPWDAIAEETARIEAAKPPLLDRINALIGD